MSSTTERTQKLLLILQDESPREKLRYLFYQKPVGFSSHNSESLERVRFAAIKLVLRGPKYFDAAAGLYHTDTRDLLMAAGFGESLQAHNIWCKEFIEAKNA